MNSFVRRSRTGSRSLAACSNSKRLAASRISFSSLRDVGVELFLRLELRHAVDFVGQVRRSRRWRSATSDMSSGRTMRLRRDAVLLVVGAAGWRGGGRSRRWPSSSSRSCGRRREWRGLRRCGRSGRWSGSAIRPSAGSLLCRRRESPPAKPPAGRGLRAAG